MPSQKPGWSLDPLSFHAVARVNDEKDCGGGCGECGEDTAHRVEVCQAVTLLASQLGEGVRAAALVRDGRPEPRHSFGRHGDAPRRLSLRLAVHGAQGRPDQNKPSVEDLKLVREPTCVPGPREAARVPYTGPGPPMALYQQMTSLLPLTSHATHSLPN